MKRLILLAIILLSLAGCVRLPVEEIADVRLVGDEGVIHAPLINGMPFGYEVCVQAGDKILIDFNPNRDQYGHRTGLGSSRYTLSELSIRCELKTEPDTIFLVVDRAHTFDDIFNTNRRYWFPCWTAPTELISGLPIPFKPLTGYPWDSCRTVGIPQMAGQTATINVTAKASWIEVEFTLPEDGRYRLDLPGQTWTDDNTIRIRIDEAGVYTVEVEDGDPVEFEVPIDWFFIEATFEIEIGPVGVC